MAGSGLVVDGKTLEDRGLVVSEVDDHLSGPEERVPTTQVPGRMGVVATAIRPNVAARTVVARGSVRADDRDALLSRLDGLKRDLSGEVRVRFEDDASRFLVCELEQPRVTPVAPHLTQVVVEVELRFLAFDPLWRDVDATVVDFTTSRAETPVGTAPSAPVVEIHGPVTDPVLTYRDATGKVVQTMGFTLTLTNTEVLTVDMGREVVTGEDGTNRLADWTSGEFFQLEPEDALALDGPYPTLEVTPEPGAAQASYRRRWR